MAMTREDNEDLTRVSRGTVMGDMLREYWHPVAVASRLEPDGAPLKVRLLGENYIAFRVTDGTLGFFSEQCPHRCASLALARNEGNGLRCIYHAWKFDVTGKVVNIPTELPESAEEIATHVRARHFPVREAGGLVWAFVRNDKVPPKFPDFDYTHFPPERVAVRQAIVPCNWVQLMEAFHDSSHVVHLHRASLFGIGSSKPVPVSEKLAMRLQAKARTEVVEAPFGTREAALRDLPDGTRMANLKEFVAPYHVLLPTSPADQSTAIITVPVDDENSIQFYVFSEPVDRPLNLQNIERSVGPPADNVRRDIGDESNSWGQDREAMKAGNFTGFVDFPVFPEDFAIAESMGRIVDRTLEYPGAVDLGVEYVRRRLIESARNFRQTGRPPWGLDRLHEFDYRKIRGITRPLAEGEDWKDIDTWAELQQYEAALREATAGRPAAASGVAGVIGQPRSVAA